MLIHPISPAAYEAEVNRVKSIRRIFLRTISEIDCTSPAHQVADLTVAAPSPTEPGVCIRPGELEVVL